MERNAVSARVWTVRAFFDAKAEAVHCFSTSRHRILEVEVLRDGRSMIAWDHDTIDDAEETAEGCYMSNAVRIRMGVREEPSAERCGYCAPHHRPRFAVAFSKLMVCPVCAACAELIGLPVPRVEVSR